MINQVNDGGPAFPFVAHENWRVKCEGMTLRDYFAGKALVAGIKNGPFANDRDDGESHHDYLARKAYEMADAMIRARSV